MPTFNSVPVNLARHFSITVSDTVRYGTLAGIVSNVVLNAKGKLIIGQCTSKGGMVSPLPTSWETPSRFSSNNFRDGCTSAITLAPSEARIGAQRQAIKVSPHPCP